MNQADQMVESSKPPFFIVGAQRSGTTMLRLMLNAHPRLAVPFETAFIPRFYNDLDEYGDLSDASNVLRLVHDISEVDFVKRGELIPEPSRYADMQVESYSQLVDRIFSDYAERYGKGRWGDKTPGHVVHLDVLREIFPESHILHLVRDGRDVAMSRRRVSWGDENIATSAQDWRWRTILGHKMGSMISDDYLLIHYEDVVLNTEETLRSICNFLGESFDEQMLGYHENADKHLPESSLQWHEASLRPPDPSKVSAWKNEMSRTDRLLFERIASDALETFGYEVDPEGLSVMGKVKAAYYEIASRW